MESEPGKGSLFRIFLPAYCDSIANTRTIHSVEASVGGNQTILLVEDEPTILRAGKQSLESLGYSVLTAATPGLAIQIAEQYSSPIDLLITDVVMPEMNGRELASRLVQLYPQMKQLFMSGYTADVIGDQGVLEEGIDFIQKPFSLTALAQKVQTTLNKAIIKSND